MDIEAELRSASDRLLAILDEVAQLENEKRTLPPDSARFKHLAREIERLSAEIFAQSHAQRTLGDRASAVAQRTGEDLAPIEATEQVRDLQLILNEWREAERRLSMADRNSAEETVARSDAARLRAEYQAAYQTGGVKRPNDQN